MAMIATDFEILRGVKASGLIKIPLARKPVRVATLINEDKFNENKELKHWETVFFEDYIHDWNWDDGVFRYYTRVAETADIVVAYAVEERQLPAKFDPMSGKPMKLETVKVVAASRKIADDWVSSGPIIATVYRVDPTDGQ